MRVYIRIRRADVSEAIAFSSIEPRIRNSLRWGNLLNAILAKMCSGLRCGSLAPSRYSRRHTRISALLIAHLKVTCLQVRTQTLRCGLTCGFQRHYCILTLHATFQALGMVLELELG